MERTGIFILSTGTELSTGRSTDTNGPYIARSLSEEGFHVRGMSIIPDDPAALVTELKRLRDLPEIQGVIMTGGLGPTEDDHTVDVLAEFTGDETMEEPAALRKLELLARRLKMRFDPEAARRQVRVLRTARVLKNEKGIAPGMFVRRDDFFTAAMPGVPQEMLTMYRDELLPVLKENYPGRPMFRRVFHLYGIGESVFQSQFFGMRNRRGDAPPALPGLPVDREALSPDFNWGVTAARGLIKIFMESFDESEIERLHELARKGYADHYVERNAQTEIHEYCLREGLTIALAESCTGGLVGKILTDMPGSSGYLKGGVIAYANSAKTDLLGVRDETLEAHGAVSAETAREMAEGTVRAYDVDFAVSITGIAGPGGGTEDKPVGTVYTACAGKNRESQTQHLFLPLDRDRVREYSANLALFALYGFMARGD